MPSARCSATLKKSPLTRPSSEVALNFPVLCSTRYKPLCGTGTALNTPSSIATLTAYEQSTFKLLSLIP
jgi:hypothetical protein